MKSCNRLVALTLLLASFALAAPVLAGPTCHGRFMNPITDICWSCVFPLTIGAAWDFDPRIDGNAAQTNHAERCTGHIDQTYRLPEADRHADARRIAAEADGGGRVPDVVLSLGEDRGCANR